MRDHGFGRYKLAATGECTTFRRIAQHNPLHISRRNVEMHSDLSTDMYELFLDQYSCAYFSGPAMTPTLARDYGVHVTAVTLSTEQIKNTRKRAQAEGLSHLIGFCLQDYREVDEVFVRIVVVDMLEHVGPPQYDTFFRKLKENLAPTREKHGDRFLRMWRYYLTASDLIPSDLSLPELGMCIFQFQLPMIPWRSL